jgi:hypothetical protein
MAETESEPEPEPAPEAEERMIPVSVGWPEDGGGAMRRLDMSTCGVDIMATNNLILWLGRLSQPQRSGYATPPATAMCCTRLTTRGHADVSGHPLLSQRVESIAWPVVRLATPSPNQDRHPIWPQSHRTESPCVSQPAGPRATHSAPVVWTGGILGPAHLIISGATPLSSFAAPGTAVPSRCSCPTPQRSGCAGYPAAPDSIRPMGCAAK